jgi:hypothetical protein
MEEHAGEHDAGEHEKEAPPASRLVIRSTATTKESASLVLSSGELFHTRLYSWAPDLKLETRVEARSDATSASLCVYPAGVRAFEDVTALSGEAARDALRVQAWASFEVLLLLADEEHDGATIRVAFE